MDYKELIRRLVECDQCYEAIRNDELSLAIEDAAALETLLAERDAALKCQWIVCRAAIAIMVQQIIGNGAARRKGAKTMGKPDNPYRKGTLIWSVMEGDWEDLAVSQIADTLCTTPKNISVYIWQIKKKTGYKVPHKIRKRGWR